MTLLGRWEPDARRWLVGALFVGMGQQLFVVLRNQYLDELAPLGDDGAAPPP